MWLETGTTLQQQIRDEFRRCSTAQGCVGKRERRDRAAKDEAGRERTDDVAGQKPAD